MEEESEVSASTEPRRSFLARFSSGLMAFGLAVGYGMFGWITGRFLLSTDRVQKAPQYIANLRVFEPGQSMTYVSPSGEKIVVTRIGESGVAGDFIALSSVCPHLGCQVHWESQNERYFCPCHNGAFDSQGRPTAGPVKEASQSLSRYELIVEDELLFIKVLTESLVDLDHPREQPPVA